MALYRCYFFDSDNHVLAPPEIIDAPDDEAAKKRSETLCDRHPHCAYVELWLNDVKVERLARGPNQGLTRAPAGSR
jgi:hypothetical protein